MQASVTEVRASSSGRHASENGSATPKSNGLARSGSGHAPLAEGAEAALLYVRFRAAAEPGLKGDRQFLDMQTRIEWQHIFVFCM